MAGAGAPAAAESLAAWQSEGDVLAASTVDSAGRLVRQGPNAQPIWRFLGVFIALSSLFCFACVLSGHANIPFVCSQNSASAICMRAFQVVLHCACVSCKYRCLCRCCGVAKGSCRLLGPCGDHQCSATPGRSTMACRLSAWGIHVICARHFGAQNRCRAEGVGRVRLAQASAMDQRSCGAVSHLPLGHFAVDRQCQCNCCNLLADMRRELVHDVARLGAANTMFARPTQHAKLAFGSWLVSGWRFQSTPLIRRTSLRSALRHAERAYSTDSTACALFTPPALPPVQRFPLHTALPTASKRC
jgi:hypothetical protein